MAAPDTHESFVEKVNNLLISRYKLGSTRYEGASTEMDVYCEKHGWFTRRASYLRNKRTTYHCKDCLTDHLGDRSADDTESWIAKAKLVFTENEYSFENSVYINSTTKISFFCNRCKKERSKYPATMLHTRKGCSTCDQEKLRIKRLEKKKSELLPKLLKEWPTYTFDLSNFSTMAKNIDYTCDEGHQRKGTPNNLLGGSGCRICGNKKQARARRTRKSDWVEKARKVHGNKYGYHLVDETFTQKSLQTIFCYEEGHGEFLCRPSNHVSLKRGCWRCGGKKESRAGISQKLRVSQDEFIKRAEAAHPHGLYDFSKSIYSGQNELTQFYCRYHKQDYKILPVNLWRGAGCYDCGVNKSASSQSLNYSEFLAKCLDSHEDDYDYSMVDYVNASTKVIVGCPEHGTWEVLPSNHMYGKSRCPVCSSRDAGKKRSVVNTKDTEWFVSKAQKVHGFKYDYSNTKYKNSREKLWIDCTIDEHGPFEQWPRIHLEGKGCPICGRESAAALARLSPEEIISRFTEIHRGRYDYSQAEIYGTDSYIKIGCPENNHGPFKQKVSTHLEGKGCPKCSLSKGETAVARILEKNEIDFEVEFGIKDGIDSKILRYDFLISGQKILLEYDGEQHYRPVTFGGMSEEKAIEVHNLIKSRDERKNVWASENGYKLIRIKYDQDIETVLKNELII